MNEKLKRILLFMVFGYLWVYMVTLVIIVAGAFIQWNFSMDFSIFYMNYTLVRVGLVVVIVIAVIGYFIIDDYVEEV